MQKRYKRLVPRNIDTGRFTPSSGNDAERHVEESPNKRPRKNVTVACIQCQRRKCKCDGVRPVCSSCVERELECSYNVAEGISRKDDLEKKNILLGSKVKDFELLIQSLRSGTDHSSTAILARLRLGDDLEDILEDLRPDLFEKESRKNSNTGATHRRTTSASTEQHTEPPTPSAHRPHHFYLPLFDRSDWLKIAVDALEDQLQAQTDATSSRAPPHGVSSTPTSSAENKKPALVDRTHPKGNPSSVRPNRKIEIVNEQSTLLPLLPRRPMAPYVKLHPNARNYFLNLPFSTSIRANHHLPDVQDQQVMNLSVPTWAMLLPHSRITPRVDDAFQEAFEGARKRMAEGMNLEQICGAHCYVAALFDEEAFNKAPFISQWAARMVHSVKRQSWGFTAFASAYLFWYVARWIIEPSPETYDDIPEWLRPTPNQLFVPHESWVDTIVWPAFRDLIVQVASMQTDTAWVINLAETIGCDWPRSTDEALLTRPETGNMDLTPEAKAAALNLENWHLAPSFRKYVVNADAYIRIKGGEDWSRKRKEPVY